MSLVDLALPPITFHQAAHYTKGRTAHVRAFVNHRMVGTLPGTTAYFQNPATRPVSTHFGVGKIDGKLAIHQYVPLDDTAYGNGNYDKSGVWDDWGYPVAEVNAQTVNIEHQDHWGDDSIKGVVLPEVQEASIKLQALLRHGTIAQWKTAGIRVRDWDANAPILKKEFAAIPVDGRHIVTHHDIAGALKPYCWLPWAKDEVGYPRTKYVQGITKWGNILINGLPVPPPVIVPLPTPPDVVTKAVYDAAVAAYEGQINALKAQIIESNQRIEKVRTLLNQIATILNG